MSDRGLPGLTARFLAVAVSSDRHRVEVLHRLPLESVPRTYPIVPATYPQGANR